MLDIGYVPVTFHDAMRKSVLVTVLLVGVVVNDRRLDVSKDIGES